MSTSPQRRLVEDVYSLIFQSCKLADVDSLEWPSVGELRPYDFWWNPHLLVDEVAQTMQPAAIEELQT
ncbi:hypothetical protein DICSQDRAFT_140751 [Dichomitus squalens LYAD-421 SS1]|uniref:Uncharacterized protein n=1 Tax=Dichomitus squalens (strain LYAD-421) TaxID=732165 RepID=R7SLH8_DICSQ|nr:uncharacterized protein DICSQDRAFT_140751 [Dichomitus squalens LYAD-421 SS1]EJF57004.1 hypothetical protein DICSQDRAFT_140751 [Dichomitus squalens LYAD-421 SS1]